MRRSLNADWRGWMVSRKPPAVEPQQQTGDGRRKDRGHGESMLFPVEWQIRIEPVFGKPRQGFPDQQRKQAGGGRARQ